MPYSNSSVKRICMHTTYITSTFRDFSTVSSPMYLTALTQSLFQGIFLSEAMLGQPVLLLME